MIIEIEIIEQISDATFGRSLDWLCNFIKSLDTRSPHFILKKMWKADLIDLRSSENTSYDKWKVEQLFRDKTFDGSERVIATQHGLNLAYGNTDSAD